ncbi:M20 metallopeptidase family protein [Brassicibacter mesophilus]|uniref:M20 metallopeptidase family protein n=1 Tax=Brassicibacter mesophilus TaxID=745119 RepID=UPI003D259AE4
MFSEITSLKRKIEEEIESIEEEVISWRRHIHQNPELSFHEYETKQYIESVLKTFDGIETFSPTETSVIGLLRGDEDGETLAFKADIDALPLQEETNISFKSKKEGVMHACGHDSHVAMMLGAAKILSKYRNVIKGNIKFIFQHAEETPLGGAVEIIEKGYIDDVDMILCIHVTPALEAGVLATKAGPITCALDKFSVTIRGKGGHASTPNETIDPIIIGTEIINSLQTIISRKISPYIPQVISITYFNTFNKYHSIIPDKIVFGGSIRSIDEETRVFVKKNIQNIIDGITKAHGGKYEIEYEPSYSATINDEDVALLAEKVIKEHFKTGSFKKLEIPYLVADSFSCYTKAKPGCFMSLGVGNKKIGASYYCHDSKFMIDESALLNGVRFLVLFGAKKAIGFI